MKISFIETKTESSKNWMMYSSWLNSQYIAFFTISFYYYYYFKNERTFIYERGSFRFVFGLFYNNNKNKTNSIGSFDKKNIVSSKLPIPIECGFVIII